MLKILNNWSFQDLKQEYIKLSLQNIQLQKNSFGMVQFLKQLIDSFPTFQFFNQNVTRQMVVISLIKEQKLLEILIEDLQLYKQ